jgi:hypothetical protein
LQKDEQDPLDPQSQSCIQDLRITDPREDKKRIEDTKGGLLRDSYEWILKHPDFQQWRDDTQSRLLWIKGDPGKGKTMLISGILDEMSPSTKLRDKQATTLLAYFFCQATDSRINNAIAVLRGLIYLLIVQQPLLVSHVREKYDHAGKALFQDTNTWAALCEIFISILQDPNLKSTYLVIDALDECERDLYQLLALINQTASISSRVKWIVSSRNQPDIESRLRLNDIKMRLSLELNEEHVTRAVELFVNLKVSKLPLIAGDSALQETVQDQIYAKANGTFLWAALVLKELEFVESWDVLDVLQDMPPELEPLYDRMLRQVEQLQRNDPKFCRLVLSTITLAYRPLHILEVGALSDLPPQISFNLDKVKKVVDKCGSFLTIRDNRTYFIHQSAKDFLLERAFNRVFPSGKAGVIYTMFSKFNESPNLHAFIYDAKRFALYNRSIIEQVPLQLYCSALVFAPENSIVRRKFKKCIPDWIQRNQKCKHTGTRRSRRSRATLAGSRPWPSHPTASRSCRDQTIETVRLWDAATGAAQQTLEGHTDSVTSVAFSPDGKQVVSGS